MPWSRFDDKFWGHPKTIAAGTTAVGLLIKATTYSNYYLTDGFIAQGVISTLIPDIEDQQGTVDRLVSAGYFIVAEGGYQIHDYLDYNPSAAEVRASRERDRVRKTGRPSEEPVVEDQIQDDSARIPDGIQTESETFPDAPSPSPSPILRKDSLVGVPTRERAPEAPSPKASSPPHKRSKPVFSEAVNAIYEITGKHAINAVQIRTIDAKITDLTRWREVINAYCLRYNNSTNIEAMLDWYVKGIPNTRSPSNGNGRGNQSRAAPANGYIPTAEALEANKRLMEREGG